MELAYSIVFLPLLWILVMADFSGFSVNYFSELDDEYDDTKLLETTFDSLLVGCDWSEGICIQAGACPWDRILEDHGDSCLAIQSDYVCCKVTQVQMPIDLFEAYGM